MKRSILLCLLFVFSINALADCPEFEVTLDKAIILGNSPNQTELHAVTLRYSMGFGHYQKLTLVYSNPSLLPKTIVDCTITDNDTGIISGYYTFDDTEIAYNSNKIINYGIYAILGTWDSQLEIKLVNEGNSFQILNQNHNIYNGEEDLETYLYSWDTTLEAYSITEEKSVSKPTERLKAMETSIASGDFKALVQQLSKFDFGGGYGSSFNKLPKKLTEELWFALHKKALALYKKGDKKEAALLVEKILVAVENVSPSEGLSEYLNYPEDENWLNYGVDALYQNSNLLHPISDCAFFLEQGDHGLEKASAIFTFIIRKYPKRLVTYLNLADASWKLKRLDISQENYETYVDMLLEKDKISVIPDYVFERMEHIDGKGLFAVDLWKNTQEAKVYKIKNTYLYNYDSHIIQASPNNLDNESMKFIAYNRVTQKQFEFSYEWFGYFFVGIINNLMIIDEGTGASRSFMLYDLDTGKLVFEGGYYGHIKLEGDELIYEDVVTLTEDQKPECPQEIIDLKYYGYVEKYTYNTKTRVFKAAGVYRCSYME